MLVETIAAWNLIPHVVRFEPLSVPESVQEKFFQRLHEHGPAGIRNAVAKMAECFYWKSKSPFQASFQTFIKPDIFQTLIDGGYDKDFDNAPKKPNPQNKQLGKKTYSAEGFFNAK